MAASPQMRRLQLVLHEAKERLCFLGSGLFQHKKGTRLVRF